MKHFLAVSDWWSSLLVGATSENPNLDAAANVATLKRIASRYDVVSIVSPDWHTVGTQVRDRLRSYAAAQGRSITLLRYAGTVSLRWGDQPGDMSVVPVGKAVGSSGKVLNSGWMLKDGSGNPLRCSVMGGQSHLLDPGSADVVATAKSHLLSLANGWDGVFLDEVGPTYGPFRYGTSAADPRYPLSGQQSPAYETARRNFVKAVSDHLAANGKVVAANVNAETTSAGYFPKTLVAACPGLKYPFLEVFATTWEGQALTPSTGWYEDVTIAMDWMAWADAQGRCPVVNCYSNDANILRYGLAHFLAAAGSRSHFSGVHPNGADEYAVEPTWLPEYALAEQLGSPTGAASTSPYISRTYTGGVVLANSGSARTVTLNGAYHAAGENADRTTRSLPAVSGAVLVGAAFGTYAAPAGTTALQLVNGSWCRPGTTTAPGPAPAPVVPPTTSAPTPTGTPTPAPTGTRTRTNLWAINPGFRSNKKGWTPRSGSTINRLTGGGPGGLTYLRMTVPAGTADVAVTNSTPNPCSGGQTLALSMWARCSVAQTAILSVETWSASGSYLGYDYAEVAVPGRWARVGRSVKLPAGAAKMQLTLERMGAPSATEKWDLTGLLLEPTAGGTFFDGATPAGGGYSYAWAGAPDASQSVATKV